MDFKYIHSGKLLSWTPLNSVKNSVKPDVVRSASISRDKHLLAAVSIAEKWTFFRWAVAGLLTAVVSVVLGLLTARRKSKIALIVNTCFGLLSFGSSLR